ncbi:reverse transcriptase domain-containing protein [Tanacetum coccineum]
MTEPPTSKEQIKGIENTTEWRSIQTGIEVVDADLKRPFKETVKTSLTRRIIEFAGQSNKNTDNIKIVFDRYDGSWNIALYRFASKRQTLGKAPASLRFLRRQLKTSLESGKLNHLIKDVRQRGRGGSKGKDEGNDKLINMIRWWPDKKKRKSMDKVESQCGRILGLKSIRGSMSIGFVGEVIMPVCKIKLEVTFEDEGLCRKIMMKFVVIRASSPYNIILGRTGLKTIRAIPSSIHSMMKCPTPRGMAKLVTRAVIISECRRLEKKQMIDKEEHQKNVSIEEEKPKEVSLIEEILVNPAYPDKLVTIEGDLSGEYKVQLRELLKKNMDTFAWQPSDMTGVPRQIIEHVLNANLTLELFCQKRRVLVPDRSLEVAREFKEWLKAGIVRLVKYPTWISNSVLIGRNLEACVDDMFIKSNDDKVLLVDIAKTFDNLQRINMKLNPKKCSFGMEEWKFLDYMSLSGKLATLNRFLARSTERSLPFFDTLKNITKENNDEYRWTEEAERAFQEMKKLKMDLPSLTTPTKEETLYVYLATAPEAVSFVLLTKRKGKRCPVYYVSRLLNKAEKSYAPLEKLALGV